ncbi:MAG: VanW family protein [Clostridia bacterium]
MKKTVKLIFAFMMIAMLSIFTGCTKDGYVADKIHVMGVDVGGLTYEEAVAKVDSISLGDEVRVRIAADEVNFELSAPQIGAEVSPKQTVDNIMEKSTGIFSGWFKKEYPAVVVVDSVMFENALTQILSQKECDVTQFSYSLEEDGIHIRNGSSGYRLDRAELATKVCEALGNGSDEEIQVSFVRTVPDEVDADAFLAGFSYEYKEAEYIRDENGEIAITEDVPGIELDKTEALSIIGSHKEEGESYIIPCKIHLSKYTREYLTECLFRDVLGTYSTSFKTSSENRATNVKLAGNSLSGTILLPGEVFSFNKTVGERTAARGYKVAAAYSAGKTVDSIGGGICQVSSTLYNSVLLSNLEIVERRSHQMTVGYVPLGRDATVSWGTQDFKFKNNTDFPVKLVTTINGRNIEISVIGTLTDPTQRVEIVTNTVSVLEPGMNIVEDNTKEVGYVDTKQGSKGYVVDAVRVVYSNGSEVSREKLTKSRYNPTNGTQTVGTMVVGAPMTDAPVEIPAVETPVVETPVVSDTGI